VLKPSPRREKEASPRPTSALAAAIRVSAAYLVAGLAWILLSDAALARLALSPETVHAIQLAKGFTFVVLSAGMILALTLGQARRLEMARSEQLRATREIAKRLALAIEMRDDDSGSHNHRIGRYSQVVAEEMGLAPSICEMIYDAAALHDVGKIVVPDAILHKPGKLTPDERRVIERHVLAGAELLGGSDDPLTSMARQIALTHHETWDGTGYPNGLRASDIPIEGRIVAVCDVFDALLSARPYKQPWYLNDAVREIVKGSGSRFDPVVVDAFVRALPKLVDVRFEKADAFDNLRGAMFANPVSRPAAS